MLANTGKPLNKDATEEENKFYEECASMSIKLCIKPQRNMT